CALAYTDDLDAGVIMGAKFVLVNSVKDTVGGRDNFWEVGVVVVIGAQPAVDVGSCRASLNRQRGCSFGLNAKECFCCELRLSGGIMQHNYKACRALVRGL